MDAHSSGFNFIAAPYHPLASPHESIYSSLTWTLELSWHSLWDFFPILRHCNTKYIASFYFLSLSLYLVLIAHSIPKLLCFEFMYLFNNGNGVLYVCVRVARSIPKLLCFGLNYLSNGNGGLYLFMFKDILG